jgi:SAM-dependent methyltransferase
MSQEKYLNMQKSFYDQEASKWSLTNRDPVVCAYFDHENFSDYDTLLFKDFETSELIALEYGCGPGRNLVRFANRFKRVDGVDISDINIEKAKLNLQDANITLPNLYVNSGNNIPVNDNEYDVIFSVICLQHICVHEIRYKIMKEIFRALKPGGYFCAQMGFGERQGAAGYYENFYDAPGTNGRFDVSIKDENELTKDLESIGFKNYKSDFGQPCKDSHEKWIWFQVQK